MTKKSDAQALVIPSGVQIQADADGFTLGNDGDVVVDGRLAIKLNRLFSTNGSIHLRSQEPLTIARVEAPNGEILLSGQLNIPTLLARKVTFAGGSLATKELVAAESIALNGETVQADIIMAPQVKVGEGVKGRATVIESKNEVGPSLLKGGFRLAEYMEIFPTGRELLEQYPAVKARLEGWDDAKVPVAAELPQARIAELLPADSDEDDERSFTGGELEAHEPDGEAEVLTLTDAVPADTPPAREITSEWNADALAEELENDSADRGETSDELYQRLSESFLKILGCYSDLKLPPPLNTLENLIEDRRFEQLRRQLTGLWNELLQYHKREGLHIANAVTHNIKEMRRLLQDR